MDDAKKIKFRPYARLLTMLSEQLITNECIALIELIKSCSSVGFDVSESLFHLGCNDT